MTFGALARSRFGSLKSWNDPMTEKISVSTSAGRMAGSLMDQAIRTSPAPSMRAASYSSVGIERSAAYRMIMLYPVNPQVTMLAMDASAHWEDRNLGALPPS